MNKRIVFIHGKVSKRGSGAAKEKRFSDVQMTFIPFENDTQLMQIMLSPELKEADKILVSENTGNMVKVLMETKELLEKIAILKRSGEELPLIKKNHAQKIKKGLKEARKNGKTLGAPKGNSNKLNKVKDYDPKLVRDITRLLKAGKSYRQIVEEIPDISISKITYMKKRFEQEGYPLH